MEQMTSRSKLFGLVAAISIVAAACSVSGAIAAPGGASQQNAEIAPMFTVPTADGGEFSLAEHLANDGRPIYLNLWASWCFPCREEMPDIDRSSHAFPDIAFIGVSIRDNRSDAEEFAIEIGVTYIIAFDDDDKVDDTYKPFGLPASYFISADGVIVERMFGKVTEEDLAEKFAEHFGL